MIPYFIPDMPSAQQLLPYLERIDANKWYSNFGPLHEVFKRRLAKEVLSIENEDTINLVSSGTAAIELALKSLDLPAHSEVLVPGFTFPATVQAVINSGLKPVICDIDANNWQLTPAIAQEALEEHTIKAVIPVAVFGLTIDSKAWAQYTKQTGIPVIVDAAAALNKQDIHHDLSYAFSLHATKPMGVGEGGLVVSPNASTAEHIRKLTNFGFESDRSISLIGTNSKLSEYHSAVGLAQLDRRDEILSLQNKIYETYVETLSGYSEQIRLPITADDSTPASLYITTPLPVTEAQESLLADGIETRRLYVPLMQEIEAFEGYIVTQASGYKNAEQLKAHGFAIPFHNALSQEDIEKTSQALIKLVNE